MPATSEPASDTSISVYTGDETQQFYHFPDDVPVPDGKVIAVEKITHKQGNPSYVVRIDTTDPAAAMAAYKAKIEAAGFTVTATGADSFSATDDVDDVVATTAMVDGKRELRVTVVPR